MLGEVKLASVFPAKSFFHSYNLDLASSKSEIGANDFVRYLLPCLIFP